MLGILVAISVNGVIGKDGDLPWHYSEDLKRFKRLTIGQTVIMGRNTWQSLPRKPLPERRNIVITRSQFSDTDCFDSIDGALKTCTGDVWFIGGARIYHEAIKVCDVLDITYVPDHVTGHNIVRFPEFNLAKWQAGPLETYKNDTRLTRRTFTRVTCHAPGSRS